jgi:type II secretory pathway pseudopilin PulG
VVEIETISVVLTGLSVSLAAIYYALTLRRQQQTRNAQAFIQLYQNAMDQGYLKGLTETLWLQEGEVFEDWWLKYGPEHNMEFFVRWWSGLVLYESVGILVKNGFVDISIVDDLISGPVLLTWERYEPIIQGIRDKYGWPQFQEWQEYLTDEIRKIVEKQHPDFRKRPSS